MPVTKSVHKILRQSQRRQALNKARKVALKKTVKKYEELLKTEPKKAAEFLSTVYKHIDKSAKVNLIKANKASRMKSRLSKKLKTE